MFGRKKLLIGALTAGLSWSGIAVADEPAIPRLPEIPSVSAPPAAGRPVLPPETTPNELPKLAPADPVPPPKAIFGQIKKPDAPTPPVNDPLGLPPNGAALPTTPTKTEPATQPIEAELLERSVNQNVTLELIGPAETRVGQPFIWELIVRNVGSTPVAEVVAKLKNHEHLKFESMEPAANRQGDSYVWSIGQLDPRQEQRVRMKVVMVKRGEVVCQATVSSAAVAATRFKATEAQLAVKQTCTEAVMVGDPVTITVAVTNPGDGLAENVVIRSTLGEGLKHEKGSQFSYELGSLAAGETRSVQLVCTAVKGGVHEVVTSTTANNGLNVSASSSAKVTEARLEAKVTGPKLRYLDRNATYTVAITNPGDAPASNVRVQASLPPGFKFVSCQGGQQDFSTGTIAWFIGSLAPNETKEMTYECTAITAGQHKHQVLATAQRSVKAAAETMTSVEGISALLLEVVDVDDPVEVGADTSYEIRVTNQGSREATNIVINALIPEQMQIRGANGPSKYTVSGREVTFAPLPKLAPKADAIYRVFVRGVGVGDLRFRAKLTSDSLSDPVIEEESTKVYND